MAAFYDEPPLPAQSDSKSQWPAGALLPDIGVMRKWTWRTLQAAKDELQLAVESVMEDIEGLGASCNSSTVQERALARAARRMHLSPTSPATRECEAGGVPARGLIAPRYLVLRSVVTRARARGRARGRATIAAPREEQTTTTRRRRRRALGSATWSRP